MGLSEGRRVADPEHPWRTTIITSAPRTVTYDEWQATQNRVVTGGVAKNLPLCGMPFLQSSVTLAACLGLHAGLCPMVLRIVGATRLNKLKVTTWLKAPITP
jgi:hypothetical protein